MVALSPIRAVSQAERGFELACQGHGVAIGWPVHIPTGEAWITEMTAKIAGKE